MFRFASPHLLALLAPLALAACLVDFPEIEDAAEICEPLAEIFCRCPGGDPGVKRCDTNGEAFGECMLIQGDACPVGSDPSDPSSGTGIPNDDPEPPPPKTSTPGEGGADPGNQGSGGSAVADACGGLDFKGECQGDTLNYCLSGEIKTIECGQYEQTCSWTSDSVGYNCVSPDPSGGVGGGATSSSSSGTGGSADNCGGVTTEGVCIGETLQYCLGGELQTVDCASTSQTCGYDDGQQWYACL